jgi:DNA-binding XRE family transcriptional regulator
MITGDMIAAGRAMAGLTRQELAARAGVSDRCIGTWERSTADLPLATYPSLVRAVEAMEAEGIRFAIDGSVRRERPSTTTLGSEEARA